MVIGRFLKSLVAVALLVSLAACGINNVPTYEEQAKAAWSNVLNQYQRRADLVPNLVATVKGAADFEKSTLEAVVNARAKVGTMQLPSDILTNPQAMQQFQANQSGLTSALSRLMVVAEQYPNLKANENFQTLQAQLEGTENRIAVARRDFIEAVRIYNTELRTIPGRWWASMFYPDAKEMAQFQADDAAMSVPKVDFGHSAGDQSLIEAGMMHRLIRLFSLLLVLSGVGLLWCASSKADPQLPPLTGRVVDQAGLLDDGARQRLTAELAQYEAKTSTQIVVVTLSDLQGYPIEQWGLALLRGWQIGQKDKNNGVVLVVAPKDRELRIETGYGVEGPLTDATSDAIIRHVIVPHFQQNDYSGGIFAGVASIEAALEGSFSAPAAESATGRSWPWPALLIGLLWLVIMLFNVFRQFGQGGTRLYTRQRRDPYWGGGWNSPGGFGGGGFGGGGGGGGFGGGGGTGGGGGASGRW